MRRFLLGFWGLSLNLVPLGELQILPRENGYWTATKLWLKFVLSWVLLFGPFWLLQFVSGHWFESVLERVPLLFCVSPLFSAFDLLFFYTFPGIRLDEDGMLVKKPGSATYSFRVYRDLVCIRQLMATYEKKVPQHSLELVFLDGSTWRTAERPEAGLPMLHELTDLIQEYCACPISPLFAVESRELVQV